MAPAKIGKSLLVFSLAFLAFRSAHAEPSLSARVSSTDISLNSSLTLTLEISGAGNAGGAPDLKIPDFQIQRAGQTVSYQWINGQASSLVNYNYLLSPTKTGTIVIPSISMTYEGKSYQTQPITINVRPESGSAPAAVNPNANAPRGAVQVPTEGLKPVFMTASVDSGKVYVGQQLLLKVQFLRRPDVRLASQAQYSEPDMTGFLVEALPQQQYNTTINGAQYEVTELPYVLFPTSDGEFAIGSARVELALRTDPDPFDPNSFFQSFFGRSQVAKLNTRAIPIHVRALPKNKPAHFSGAVGRFKISAKVDSTEPEVGKPFNLILTVEGVGNVKTIKEPALPELRGFRRYETISSSKVSKDGKFLHGSKEFKILLIPQVSGAVTIPAITFSYFNPDQADYMTDSTADITLQVKAGKLNPSDSNMLAEPVIGQTTESVRVMEKDIRFLKSGKVRPIRPPLFQRGYFYFLNLLPPLFALVAFVSRRQSQIRITHATEYRFKGALRQAMRRLKQAKEKIKENDPIPFYGNVHNALAGFLADKLNLSPSGLVWDDVERRLMEKGVDADLRGRVRSLFEEADMARFATSSFDDQARESSLKATEGAMVQLDKFL